tara:strand:+ start:712 stop:885 length:174 start_codon:yes stop_codon:yes gene_type:complete
LKEVKMTKDERQELRDVQEGLIEALAKITEMLGTKRAKRRPPAEEYDSAAKERFIAP